MKNCIFSDIKDFSVIKSECEILFSNNNYFEIKDIKYNK